MNSPSANVVSDKLMVSINKKGLQGRRDQNDENKQGRKIRKEKNRKSKESKKQRFESSKNLKIDFFFKRKEKIRSKIDEFFKPKGESRRIEKFNFENQTFDSKIPTRVCEKKGSQSGKHRINKLPNQLRISAFYKRALFKTKNGKSSKLNKSIFDKENKKRSNEMLKVCSSRLRVCASIEKTGMGVWGVGVKENRTGLEQTGGRVERVCLASAPQLGGELTEWFSFQRRLGRGAFSVVYSAVEKSSNKQVALKLFEKSGTQMQSQLDLFKNEIVMLQLLNHQKVAKLIRYFESPNHYGLVLELVESVTLSCFLKKFDKEPSFMKHMLYVFRQLVEVVCHCHGKGVFHRDIKTSNVLVKKDLSIVLIDFGFAIQLAPGETTNGFCGTLNYMAPEILLKQEYNPGPVDVWALGVLLWFSLSSTYPFVGELRRKNK